MSQVATSTLIPLGKFIFVIFCISLNPINSLFGISFLLILTRVANQGRELESRLLERYRLFLV